MDQKYEQYKEAEKTGLCPLCGWKDGQDSPVSSSLCRSPMIVVDLHISQELITSDAMDVIVKLKCGSME